MNDFAKGGYDMILVRYLLTSLESNLKWSEHTIEVDDGPFKGSKILMFDLGVYAFKYLNTVNISLEEYFTNAYSDKLYESEHASNAIKRLLIIFDAKYEK